MRLIIPPLMLAALTGVAACSGGALDEGGLLFRQNCVTCHGRTGAGDGPMADKLPVRPANLRGLSAANGGVFPAERVMATIYGYSGKNYRALMPEFGPVLESPPIDWTAPDGRVISTPSALVALAGYIETLQDP